MYFREKFITLVKHNYSENGSSAHIHKFSRIPLNKNVKKDQKHSSLKQTFNKYLTNATFWHLLPFTFVFLILEISTVKKRPNFRENKNKLIRSKQALKLPQNVNEVFYKVKHKIMPTKLTPSFCL